MSKSIFPKSSPFSSRTLSRTFSKTSLIVYFSFIEFNITESSVPISSALYICLFISSFAASFAACIHSAYLFASFCRSTISELYALFLFVFAFSNTSIILTHQSIG
jgi:hypothetical protein